MKVPLAAVALSLVVVLCPAPSQAQATLGTQPATASFASFWSKFKAAVARDDRQAVASMTKFPFPFDNKELTKPQFIKIYTKLFDRRIKRCFTTAKPVRDGDAYSIFCGEQGIIFERTGDAYKFTSFFAND